MAIEHRVIANPCLHCGGYRILSFFMRAGIEFCILTCHKCDAPSKEDTLYLPKK